MRFYCGTYTTKLGHVDGRAKGIGVYELDGETGQIRHVGNSPGITNSSHMCLSKDRQHLYVSSEVIEHAGQRDGYMTVFAVDPADGMLSERQKVSSSGPGPAYVHLDGTGRFLLLANYVAGNVVVNQIENNGLLGEPVARVAHTGSSVNKARQQAAHPHAIVPSPDNRFVYVPDLGMDRIVAYRLDADSGELTPAPELDVVTPPGSGPRHLVFGPDAGQGADMPLVAYCSLELTSELAVYQYAQGKLTETARLSTLPTELTGPADFTGSNTTAEVRVSGDGRHVYVSNRGHDSIAVFSTGDPREEPQLVEVVSTAGRTPRNFGLAPDGNWLVAGNQDSHTLVAFRRDPQSGRITQVGEPVECPSPALICFVYDK